jgi:murein DD-endopeptidase MepM/ murein hydrolase activator NlpD
MEYDNAVMQRLKETRQQIADTKAEMECARAEQERAREAQQEAAAQLEEKIEEAAALVNAIENEEEEYAEALAELKAEEERIDKLIAQRQKELEELIRQNRIQFDPGSGYYYPLPSSYTRISSRFGYRSLPLPAAQPTTGIDIPAPKNTVFAFAAAWFHFGVRAAPYGNYVVIQHDKGVSSLYPYELPRGDR